MMEFADKLSKMINVFGPEPLDEDTFESYYCEGTMKIRMNDPYMSPMDDIHDECIMPTRQNAHLLLGHRGCGKSTELNRLKKRLEEEGHEVSVIACTLKADLPNITYYDLLILATQELFYMADNIGCKLDAKRLERIERYWDSIEVIREIKDSADVGISAAAEASTPPILSILKIFTKMTTELKSSDETRKIIRERVKQNASEWLENISYVSNIITSQLNGKQPILIFEDLDKMEIEVAWKIFSNYASPLSQIPFPIIYTFPIGLSYDYRFPALESYFHCKILPMIMVHSVDGAEYPPGIKIIEEIVKKRADLSLFEPAALKLMIQKTGGSLRDLFVILMDAARRAEKRKSEKIEIEDSQRVLTQLKSGLTRRFDKSYYPLFKEISSGKRKEISDKEALLKMMMAMVVLEYNGDGWRDLHPLVLDFLIEQEII